MSKITIQNKNLLLSSLTSKILLSQQADVQINKKLFAKKSSSNYVFGKVRSILRF